MRHHAFIDIFTFSFAYPPQRSFQRHDISIFPSTVISHRSLNIRRHQEHTALDAAMPPRHQRHSHTPPDAVAIRRR